MENLGTGCENREGEVYDVITDKKIPKYRIFTYNVGNAKYCFDLLTLYKSYLIRGEFFNPYTNEKIPEDILASIKQKITEYLFQVIIKVRYFPDGLKIYKNAYDKKKFKDQKIWNILEIAVKKTTNLTIDDLAVSNIYFKINESNMAYDFYTNYAKDFNYLNIVEFYIENSNYPFTEKINIWEYYLLGESLEEASEFNRNFFIYYDELRYNLLANNNPAILDYIKEFPLKGTSLITYNGFEIITFCEKNNLLYVFNDLIIGIYNIVDEFPSFLSTLIKYIAVNNNIPVLLSIIPSFQNSIKSLLKVENWKLFVDIIKSEYVINSTRTYFAYMFMKELNALRPIMLDIAYDAIYTNDDNLLTFILTNGFLKQDIIQLVKHIIVHNPALLKALKFYRVFLVSNEDLVKYAQQKGINLEEELI